MKTQLKQTVIAVLTSAVLLTSPAANASGIPTVDGANIAQGVQSMLMDIMNQAETIQQWTTNFEHLKTQIQNQIDQLNAIKNVKDLDDVLKIMNTINDMPQEWADMYKTVEKLDPTGELAKLKYDPELAMKNAMNDIAILNAIEKQFDPNNKTGTHYRLKQATDLLKSADSEIALQKVTAMILAEQTRIQQAQFQYATIKEKYGSLETANREKQKEREHCYVQQYINGNGKDLSKCHQ